MKYLACFAVVVGVLVVGYLANYDGLLSRFSYAQDRDARQDEDSSKQKKLDELDETRFDDPEYWKNRLSAEQFHVTREQGTEPAFRNKYFDNKKKGLYRCICCNEPLFDSTTKFDSGTGWPSFNSPTEDKQISEIEDRSLGTVRTEVKCAKCDAHLGHVFPWRSQPTGLRYCINSASLDFQQLDKDGKPLDDSDEKAKSTAADKKNKSGKAESENSSSGDGKSKTVK